MIPFTFPTYVQGDGTIACRAKVITDTTGLVRWIDYTPIKFVASMTNMGTTNNDGSQAIELITQTTGLVKGIDYIVVYVDSSATVPWSTNANGYIPCYSAPYSLFASSETGVWYDPSDFTTLFQDSAGTTPVTAVEQPVGKMLDKSGRGNHATQATAASRPVVSARVNLLTKTEDFGDAAWMKGTEVTATSGYILETATTQTHAVYASAVSVLPNTAVTARVEFSPRGRNFASVQLNTNGVVAASAGFFDLINGTFTLSTLVAGLTSVSGSCTMLADGYVSCSLTATGKSDTTAIQVYFGAMLDATTRSYAGDITKGVNLRKADLRIANTGASLPVYQRVNTSTDYDTVGFPHYLKFDGIDDSMATGSIDFTSTDKMTVFAGVRKLSDAAVGMVVELSATSAATTNTWCMQAPSTDPVRFMFASHGSAARVDAQRQDFAAPITVVSTGLADIAGDAVASRINGGNSVTATTDQGTGNYGNYPLYIGARAGTSLFFNGNLYSMIVRAAQSSGAQITSAETYVNGKTKAY